MSGCADSLCRMEEAIIRTEGLKKSFGKVQAVKGVDLYVEQGTVFGLLGPNGAGKTTTIESLRPSSSPTKAGPWSQASTWSATRRCFDR